MSEQMKSRGRRGKLPYQGDTLQSAVLFMAMCILGPLWMTKSGKKPLAKEKLALDIRAFSEERFVGIKECTLFGDAGSDS